MCRNATPVFLCVPAMQKKFQSDCGCTRQTTGCETGIPRFALAPPTPVRNIIKTHASHTKFRGRVPFRCILQYGKNCGEAAILVP